MSDQSLVSCRAANSRYNLESDSERSYHPSPQSTLLGNVHGGPIWKQNTMVKKSVDCSGVQSAPTREVQRIALTIQCSAPRSQWAAKWTSLCLIPKFGPPRIPAVSASLRVKLPRAILKLSLAVRSSVQKGGSNSTVQKTVKFFGTLRIRKVCLRLSGCITNLKEKALLRAASVSKSGGLSLRDGTSSTQHRKLAKSELVEQQKRGQKATLDKCGPDLASWVSIRRISWQDQLTRLRGLVGDPPLLPHFAGGKEGWAVVVRAGVVLWTLNFLGRLVIRAAASNSVFTVIAVVFLIVFVLNFVMGNDKLNSALWRLWSEVVHFGRGTVLPQVVWAAVELVTRGGMLSGMLFGTSAFSIIILLQRCASSWDP